MIKTSTITFSTAMVSALALALAVVAPAMADDSKVVNDNDASIVNEVYVGAFTGANSARGGDGDRGARGGDASSRGGDAVGGHGGFGGNGASGGLVVSGSATAVATVLNDANYNETDVEGCGCETEEAVHPCHGYYNGPCAKSTDSDDIRVRNRNTASLANFLAVEAHTGDNDVAGGNGDRGARGGDAETEGYNFGEWHNMHYPVYLDGGNATGGNGGDGGTGGAAGEVVSGDALSDALVETRVNRNVTRVTR